MSLNDNRPLSPHLQVYKPQLSSVLSITHRATGVALSVGALFLAAWFVALAQGGESWDCMQALVSSWFGQLCVFGWTFALMYHLCNGLRHLVWDLGWGLEMDTANKSGLLVIVVSLVLTAAVWALACFA